MQLERTHLVETINLVADVDPDLADKLGLAFALYDHEIEAERRFYREKLGFLTVAADVEIARNSAAEAIKEAEYRWQP